MSLIIRKPGIFSTVQDLGRTGYRRLGINPGGVMDRTAARLVNILLGNSESTPVLEMHFPAPEIEFDSDTAFAIGGADFGAELSGRPQPNWSTSFAKRGEILRYTTGRDGTRAYLSVAARLDVDQWLGSSSTNLAAGVGGISGRALIAGDLIRVTRGNAVRHLTAGNSILPRYSRFPTVRVVSGPEFDCLTATAERLFLSEGFTLSRSCNRMGYRLEGPPLDVLDVLDNREMVSAAVTFGTIQLLPDGQLIILMADHQTSGGYRRIANVISVDLPLLAQCGPGDGVGFTLVPNAEAEHAALRFERELNYLRVGCRLLSDAYGGS